MDLLQGIKVIELAQWMAAPAAAAILSDWGADVIKIEDPPGGDALRGYSETRSDYPKTEINGPFELDNRNKRSVAVNLRNTAGQEIVHKLVREADIFITNFRSQALDRFCMAYETLSSINTSLIFAELSGYGEVGPDKEQPGFDRSAYFARSGIQDILREPGAPPSSMRPAFGDHMASGFFVAGILGALCHRERTGTAQKVSLSLYHCGIWQLGTDLQVSLLTGKDIPKASRSKAGNPLTNHYQTKDGRWIVLAMPQSDRYWPNFCEAIGRKALELDPRYENHQARAQNAVSLVSLLDEVLATDTYANWKVKLDKHAQVFGLVQSPVEVTNDAQAWADGMFASVEHPVAGKINLIKAPGRFSKTPGGPKSAAPEVGQHTEEVLIQAGYTWDDISRLKEEQVII
ncbi:CaiB/BaiF CoA transferase family protein [Chloroflexota bacterium]